MVALERWQKAQQYEQSWWKKVADKVENGAISQLDWYQWKARELEKRIEPFTGGLAIKSARVLEIGSGPIGIVNFLEWGECFAIDPLEDYQFIRIPVNVGGVVEDVGRFGEINPTADFFRYIEISPGAGPPRNVKVNFMVFAYKPSDLLSDSKGRV